MDKHTYFVTLDTMQVQEQPYDDQVKYYEVLATKEEIHEINMWFEELHKSEEGPGKYKEPLNEKSTQERRNMQQLLIDKIFVAIYELGTEQTREEIKTMNGLNQRV